MSNIYSWKVAVPIIKGAAGSDPQKVGEAIEQLGGIDKVKPQKLAEAARTDPVLHGHFTWDDVRCGELHRRQEARQAAVERIASDGVINQVPAFVSITTPGAKGPTYQPVSAIESSVDLQRIMLANALGDLRGWMKRYSSLVSVCNLLRPAIAALEQEMAQFDTAAATAAGSVTNKHTPKRRGGTQPTVTP